MRCCHPVGCGDIGCGDPTCCGSQWAIVVPSVARCGGFLLDLMGCRHHMPLLRRPHGLRSPIGFDKSMADRASCDHPNVLRQNRGLWRPHSCGEAMDRCHPMCCGDLMTDLMVCGHATGCDHPMGCGHAKQVAELPQLRRPRPIADCLWCDPTG